MNCNVCLTTSKLSCCIFIKKENPVQVFSIEFSGNLKGALSGLRQFLAIENPIKMMENAFYFTSKALFVFNIFKFLS